DYIIDYMRSKGVVSSDMDPKWIGRFLDGLRARERAVLCYKPKYCNGKITLFRASEVDAETRQYFESQGWDLNDPTLGWGQLASEPVEVHFSPGYHESIVFEPNVSELAAKIRACIDRAEIVCATA
ncbi:MAG: hypothetical protein ACREDR_08480, partial [Blastocatellia bacterium]